MKQSILHVALMVKDYDEAIEFYCSKLKFTLVDDTYQAEQDKRWVVVSPPGGIGTKLHLEGLRSDNLPIPQPSSRVEYVEVAA